MKYKDNYIHNKIENRISRYKQSKFSLRMDIITKINKIKRNTI